MSLKLWVTHQALKRSRAKERKQFPWIGERFMMPRANNKDVETILYLPKNQPETPLPCLFNVHGGAWVGCDATLLDTQSQLLADKYGCFVVNINYTKVDEKPFPYMQEEVRDTVLYFAQHAAEYCLDDARFTVMGYSAGGHVCAGTAMMLRDAGFKLNSQILCYPFLNFSIFDAGGSGLKGMQDQKALKLMNQLFFRGNIDRYSPVMSPSMAEPSKLMGLAPAELIVVAKDDLYPQAMEYKEHLEAAGVPVVLKQYEKAEHGFLECYWPENISLHEYKEDQKNYRDEAIAYIGERLKALWGNNNDI